MAEALELLVQVLNEEQAGYALIGGLASAIRG